MQKEDEDLVLPTNVNDLVKLLNELYPEKSPLLSDEPKDMYFKAGQRDVINFINTLKERTEK